MKDVDCLRTITRFTAESIAYGLRHFIGEYPDQLIIGGGGSHNPLILADLADCLPGCAILTGEDVGYCSDSKEAVAFAVLASLRELHECAFRDRSRSGGGVWEDHPVST